jgi:hypothetical protein
MNTEKKHFRLLIIILTTVSRIIMIAPNMIFLFFENKSLTPIDISVKALASLYLIYMIFVLFSSLNDASKSKKVYMTIRENQKNSF